MTLGQSLPLCGPQGIRQGMPRLKSCVEGWESKIAVGHGTPPNLISPNNSHSTLALRVLTH